MMNCDSTDWFFHEQTQEYQNYWISHSNDGFSPELDYNQLISTIVELHKKIAELEKRLDKQEEYQQEQND